MILIDVCELIVDCPHSTANDEGAGYPLIRTPNVGKGRLILDGVHRVSKQVYDVRNARAVPKAGDLILAREAPAGNVAIILDGQEVCLGQRTVLIRPDKSKVNPQYLTYYLLAPYAQHELTSAANGATVAHVNMPKIRGLKINLPDIQEQNRIAGILSTYDDLIATNQKQIYLLEEAAQRLYKEWFCFKHTPATEKDDISDYLIKRGWKKSKIGDIFNTYLGGTPSREKKEFWEKGTIPWINSGEVNRLRIVKPSEMITEQALRKSATKLLPKHTTLVAITGATLGQVSFTEIETCANQSVVGIYDGQDIYNYYLYHFVSQHIGEIVAKATGGAQQHINKDIINDYSIILPPVNVIREYNPLVAPIFESIKVLLFQNIFLSEARDLMLKELIVNSDSR